MRLTEIFHYLNGSQKLSKKRSKKDYTHFTPTKEDVTIRNKYKEGLLQSKKQRQKALRDLFE